MHTHLTHLSLQATLHSLQSPLPHPPTPEAHDFQCKRDAWIPFLACPARWLPHLEIHFLQALPSQAAAAWRGVHRPGSLAPFLLLAAIHREASDGPGTSQGSAPFCSVTNSLSHALVLPTSPTSVICQPTAPGSVDILTSGVDAKPCCEYHVNIISSSFWDLGLLQGRMYLCNVTLGEGI